jgi:hypothetical protein
MEKAGMKRCSRSPLVRVNPSQRHPLTRKRQSSPHAQLVIAANTNVWDSRWYKDVDKWLKNLISTETRARAQEASVNRKAARSSSQLECIWWPAFSVTCNGSATEFKTKAGTIVTNSFAFEFHNHASQPAKKCKRHKRSKLPKKNYFPICQRLCCLCCWEGIINSLLLVQFTYSTC